MKKMIAVRLDQELLSKVGKLVTKTGRTRTAFIERGLELVLKEIAETSR